MNVHCPECGSALPTERLGSLCPVCFFAAASEPGLNGLVRLRVSGLSVGDEIARGGMGIVYAAEQDEPRRPVALKVLLPQWLENPSVLERFRRESQAMAQLEHAAILPVYSVGETDGLPWFTMKLATAGSLAERIPSFAGRWTDAAKLVARLADALGHAHERGVLHRDIKPGNILFDSEGRTYLADFGLAKQQWAAIPSLTLHADVLGTPNYLAPEVASGRARAATTSSDIYSLGAVLYELLSGRPPHRDDHLPALLRRVADDAPLALSGFKPTPPRDLQAICEKAIAREPGSRYATARGFAEDLQRFLHGELVHARNSGTWELVLRSCRRHPVVALLIGLVSVLSGILAVGSTVAMMKIRRAELVVIAERDRAEASLRLSQLAEAEGLRRARQPRFRQMALERVVAAGIHGESMEMHVDRRSEAIASLALPSLHHSPFPTGPTGWELAALAPGHGFHAWRSSQGEGWLVTRAGDGLVVSSNQLAGIPTHMSRDGRWLTARSEDRTTWQLWDLSKLEARLECERVGNVEDLSDDGNLVALTNSSADGTVTAEVLETVGERVRFRLGFPAVSLKIRFNGEGNLCAIAPSSYLNDSEFPYSVRVHRCEDGAVQRELSGGLGNCIWAMEFSRDGELLAAGERGGATFVWEVATGNARHVIRGTGANPWQVAFSDDGRTLALISDDRLLTLYDTVGGQPVARAGEAWQSDTVPVLSWSAVDPAVFGPISQDDRETFLVLKPGAYSSFVAPNSHGSVLGIGIAPGGRWLAVGDSRHARLWDLQRAQVQDVFAPGLWNSFVFSPDGRWLFGAGEPGIVRWEMSSEGLRQQSRVQLMPPGWHNAVALDATGDCLAAESGDSGSVRIISNPNERRQPHADFPAGPASWISLSPDGRYLAVAGWEGMTVWNRSDRAKLVYQTQAAHWVQFSPDGLWLVVGRDRYEVLRTSDWALVKTLDSRVVGPMQSRAAFTSDGRWLATGHPFGKIALWRVPSWDRIAVLESPNGHPVGRFVFDDKGHRLFNASTGGVIEAWDLVRLEGELRKLRLEW